MIGLLQASHDEEEGGDDLVAGLGVDSVEMVAEIG